MTVTTQKIEQLKHATRSLSHLVALVDQATKELISVREGTAELRIDGIYLNDNLLSSAVTNAIESHVRAMLEGAMTAELALMTSRIKELKDEVSALAKEVCG